MSLGCTAEGYAAASRRLDLREAIERGGAVEIRMSLPRRLHAQIGVLMSMSGNSMGDVIVGLVAEGLDSHQEEIRECLGL